MKFVVIILALLYLVSHTEWFNLFSTLTHGDWHSFEQQTLATLRIDHFGTWLSDKGFGRFIYDIAQGISWAIPGYLAKYLGMSFAMSERLVWFFPMMVFAIYGSYLFFNLLLKNKYAVL